MRILRLRAYFEPEITASNNMSDDMDRAYADNGIINVIYTPAPTRGVSDETRKRYRKIKYEEKSNGAVIVNRFWMFREKRNPVQRAFRYLCCSVAEYYKGIHAKDIGVVHSGSTPPTQGMLSALVAKKLSKKYKRRVPFVYNLQDIFPDSLVTTRMTNKGSLIWKIGRKIEDFTYKNAEKIIVINNRFKSNIMEKGVPEEKIEVIANWIDTDAVMPVKRENNSLIDEFKIDPDKFLVVYAGNFGESQGADIIVRTAKLLKNEEHIRFVIFGGGPCYNEAKLLAEKEGLSNILMLNLLGKERISEVYSLGDVALITCKKGSGGAAMPSKLWSIMACNTPVIAAFDCDSELSDVINKSGAGICVEPENEAALAQAIKDAGNYGIKKDDCCEREYCLEHASKKVCVEKYLNVLVKAYERNEVN